MDIEPLQFGQLSPEQKAMLHNQRGQAWQYESEREWHTYVVELAHVCGWRTYHTHDSRRSNPGWPDLAIWKPPQFMLVELKTNKGKLSRTQQMVLAELHACHVEVHVWRPVDEHNVRARLKDVKHRG
jgi:hypothetical protein